MKNSKLLRIYISILLAFIFTSGCGGKKDDANDNGPSSKTELFVTVNSPQIEYSGETTLLVGFVDEHGDLMALTSEMFSAMSELKWNSRCIDSYQSAVGNPTVSTAQFQFTYSASICEGEDTIVASTRLGDVSLSFDFSVAIARPIEYSMSFVAATSETLLLDSNDYLNETTLRFRLSTAGELSEVSNERIDFHLSGDQAAGNLSSHSTQTDNNGFAEVKLMVGETSGSVQVVAVHSKSAFEAESSVVHILSPLVSAEHFAIAADKVNVGAWGRLNSPTVLVSAIASDMNGNPVEDGTRVDFISEEAGAIVGSCYLQAGHCGVEWKPNGREPQNGRIQILATVKG